ncbi:penicillin acylase family protein [Sorangium sp. So ce295]|uniref:penicillin acylase family protein n=1 Tax=Sorangium sp. So ce295 TaxID=3133295 RepID=UPI003F605872
MDPDPAVGALSVRWTGLTPTKELEAIFGLLRARSVDDAQESLSKFSVGAQNWVMGDAAGDILWTTHAAIPTRSREAFAWDAATYTGVLPCMVLPGDGTAEWTGTLPEHLIPRAKNPPAGYIATANNDPIGDSLDNDPSNGALPDGTPMYLGCSFDIGFREGRIQERIDAHEGPLSPEDCAAIQGDIKSALGARLVPHLLGAMDRADEERATPGTHPDLTVIVADAAYVPQRLADLRALLDGWGKEADYKAAAGIDLDTATPLADEGDGPGAIDARASEATLVFNLWLVRVVRRVLGDELGQMGFSSFSRELSAKALLHLFSADREQLATFDPAVQDSALWDDMGTPAVESRDERVLRALLDALAWLDRQGGSGAAAPRWGAFHTVTFDALVPLSSSLSIPPPSDPLWSGGFPRGGDEFAVDSSDYRLSWALDESPDFRYVHGPSQRLVVELDPAGPKAWNAIPGGNVWDAESPHFRDQAELWRKNQTHLVIGGIDTVLAAIAAYQPPFRRVIGGESSTATASVARANVGVVAGRSSLRAPVDVLTCNALSFDFPPAVYPTQIDGKRSSTAAAQQLPARPAAAKAHTARLIPAAGPAAAGPRPPRRRHRPRGSGSARPGLEPEVGRGRYSGKCCSSARRDLQQCRPLPSPRPASFASYEVVVLAPPLTGFATDLLLPGALLLR